jgi:hypothetical protein
MFTTFCEKVDTGFRPIFIFLFYFVRYAPKKKENKIVLINKEFRWERFQSHTGTLYEEMLKCLVMYLRRPLVIYEERFCSRSLPDFFIYEENLVYFFIIVSYCRYGTGIHISIKQVLLMYIFPGIYI